MLKTKTFCFWAVMAATGMVLYTASTVFAADEPEKPVVVASKPDVEGRILGHIIAEILKSAEIEVVERIGSGNTVELRKAVKAGDIDIYPEYTGLGALMYPTIEAKTWLNPGEAFQTLKETDFLKNSLVWLKAAPADAGWRIACKRDFALEHKLTDMNAFAEYLANGGKVVLACCEAFVERSERLPAFQRAYGFMLQKENFVVIPVCDTTEAERLLSQSEQGVNFSMAFGTDPALKKFGLIALDDVKHSQIVYQPSPVVREEVSAAYPQLKQILTPVFGALTSSTLRSLNAAVAYDGMSPKESARAYLESHGFITNKPSEAQHEVDI